MNLKNFPNTFWEKEKMQVTLFSLLTMFSALSSYNTRLLINKYLNHSIKLKLFSIHFWLKKQLFLITLPLTNSLFIQIFSIDLCDLSFLLTVFIDRLIEFYSVNNFTAEPLLLIDRKSCAATVFLSLPANTILFLSKQKAFANDNFKVTDMMETALDLVKTVGKGENAC